MSQPSSPPPPTSSSSSATTAINTTSSTSSSISTRDQQFCLRWNNYQTNLTQVFNQLFQTEQFVDVTLACEGNSVKAHRMVLSACSPYFSNVLTQTPCSHPVIILQGVKWTELKAVVEFMYKGEINVCQEQLASLLRVAESLKIRGLTDVGGEEAEAIITTPSGSPRATSQFWSATDSTSRKRRRLSEEPRSGSRSRSSSPPPRPHTPASTSTTTDVLESMTDMIPATLSRGSASSTSNHGGASSLPSSSPVASLASSLSSFAHFHAPMPPPGPPLPPHLAHLPPLSPLSPLLNMHPMNRHHSPEDFEIRPGIAEMIREEERVSDAIRGNRRIDKETYAKLIESTHHWMSNPMADSYQAQVQAAWQKSWNQTQSLLQNLRFRERGPLKSWRPETMAEAIHAVLKEGLSLSQSARKYDIPYPTFVLYANRVHNLLGPSHEPGDMRPKGRGRPQRILLGSWPEDQIKGVIRAVVFRDTTVFRDGDHKENKKPAVVPQIKDEHAHGSQGPFSSNGNSDKSGNSTPIPPSTPGTSQPLPPGSILPPMTTPPTPSGSIPPKQEIPDENTPIPASSTPGLTNTSAPSTPLSRPSSNGPPHSSGLSQSPLNNNLANKINPSINQGAISPVMPNGVATSSQSPMPLSISGGQNSPPGTPNALHNSLRMNRGAYPGQTSPQLGRMPAAAAMNNQQQMLGLLAGGLGGAPNPSHMARLFGEGAQAMSGSRQHSTAANAAAAFPVGFPRAPQGMGMGLNGLMNSLGQRMNTEESDPSPESLLFGKIAAAGGHNFNSPTGLEGRGSLPSQFNTSMESSPPAIERPLMFRDGLDAIKSEPEAIMN